MEFNILICEYEIPTMIIQFIYFNHIISLFDCIICIYSHCQFIFLYDYHTYLPLRQQFSDTHHMKYINCQPILVVVAMCLSYSSLIVCGVILLLVQFIVIVCVVVIRYNVLIYLFRVV